MDMLDLDKLMRDSKVFERITEGTVDDSAYNAVTQCINESAIMESREEVEGILSRGNDVNDRLDFADLERTINGALGITESAKPKIESDKKEKEMKTQPINEAAANPSTGVDSAEKFLKAQPVKQKEFVKAKTDSKDSTELDAANTNSEHVVTEHKSNKSVEKQAESSMKEMQKDADDNKEWEENSKKQEKAEAKSVLKENADKYIGFIESLKTDENAKYINGIIEAFNVTIKPLI